MWTDETHFHLIGYVNTQNYGIWSTGNPLELQPAPLSPANVTHYAILVYGIIYDRAIFFEETSAIGVLTVNATDWRYECLLQNHVILAL